MIEKLELKVATTGASRVQCAYMLIRVQVPNTLEMCVSENRPTKTLPPPNACARDKRWPVRQPKSNYGRCYM